MADERVDKGWQKRGLKDYSTQAILGTLAHYGVTLDEAGFKAASEKAYPLQLATGWHERWKGTGQFAKFPYAAASELFRRAWPDRLAPDELGRALAELITALTRFLDGRIDEAQVRPAFDAVKALEAKLPADDETLSQLTDESVMLLGEEGARRFDELAERLARAGDVDLARKLAALEERLLPERRGIASAVVQVASGESGQGIAALEAALEEEGRSDESKVMAVDALIHFEAFPQATAAARRLLDRAEAAEDYHLGLSMCERLGYLFEKQERWKDLEALASRARALADAHDKAHPHHAHHH